ncbi:MAG: NAD kinase [Bacteroidia bacterium]|nr:NAD kinase [Bacteroidia bacterium]
MKQIAIYARPTKDNPPDMVEELLKLSEKENFSIVLHHVYAEFLLNEYGYDFTGKKFRNSEELVHCADYLISMGGDGTMLESKNLVGSSGIPVLGINTGRLGFLAVMNKSQAAEAVEMIVKEKFILENRLLLQLHLSGQSDNKFPGALNEISIKKPEGGSMIFIDTTIDNKFLTRYYADGLIVSTPTGSTAYSLSCGGPVLMPDAENFILTPIAPHNLNMRPLVIPSDKKIKINVICRTNDQFNVSIDSQSFVFNTSQTLEISKAPYNFRMLMPENNDFFQTLRNKLFWGLDSRK